MDRDKIESDRLNLIVYDQKNLNFIKVTGHLDISIEEY